MTPAPERTAPPSAWRRVLYVLEGEAFPHDYDPGQDLAFTVLPPVREPIVTKRTE